MRAGEVTLADRAREGKGAVSWSPSRPGRSLAVLAVALLAGLAVGRFLTFQASPVLAPATSTAATPLEMIAVLEGRVSRNPDDLTALQALGLAYLRRAAQVGDPSFYGLAEEAFQRAEALAPEDPATQLGRAALALALHEFDTALQLASRAHAGDPFDADALGVMVDAEVELARYEQAARHLQMMLDLRPDVAALSRTSYLRELNGDVAGAMQAMQQARTAAGSPFDLATVTALAGDLAFGQGDLEVAGQSYREALRLSPDLVVASVGAARVEAAGGDLVLAIDRLRQVVDRYPHPGAVILLGDLLALEGSGREAQQTYELMRAIGLLQREAGQVVDLEMAAFEADRGDPKVALELARRSYQVRPTIHAADALAWALHRSGRDQEARPYVEEALRLGTRDALLRFHAAAIFAELGEEGRARQELRDALEINPWFSFLQRGEAATLAARIALPTLEAWGRP
jgi:tetratricopeptide (TPR) repeat protein